MSVGCNDINGATIEIQVVEVGDAPTFSSASFGIVTKPLGSVYVQKSASVQTITVSATSVDLNGFFFVHSGGEISDPIDVESSAAEVKSILDGMVTINSVKVTMDLGKLDVSSLYYRKWTIVFEDEHPHSLTVSTGGSHSITSSGGTMLGSEPLVAVEVIDKGSLPNMVEINDLNNSNKYVARITACLVAGGNNTLCSKSSMSPIASSPQLSVPAAPLNVWVNVLSDTEVLVEWTASEKSGGSLITSTIVQWSNNALFGKTSQSASVKAGTTSYLISNIESSMLYVKAAYVSVVGTGAYTAAKPKSPSYMPKFLVINKPCSDFKLIFTDSENNEITTERLDSRASSESVQAALVGLPQIKSATVMKIDQSNDFDATTSDSDCDISYHITLVSGGLSYSVGDLSLQTSTETKNAIKFVDGYSPDALFVMMDKQRPSIPVDVKVFSVSASELGVSWKLGVSDGGLNVTKCLIEWNHDLYFPVESSAKYSEIVTVESAKSSNTIQPYSYQIFGLNNSNDVYTRVSCFNDYGYSYAAASFPKACGTYEAESCDIVSLQDDCETNGKHCSIKPVNIPLYKVVLPKVDINRVYEMRNRLDIVWTQPLNDINGFISKTSLPHTPAPANFYNFEWSVDANFLYSTTYTQRTIEGENNIVTCETEDSCGVTIGIEVQKIEVISGSTEQLTGGDMVFLYVGQQNEVVKLVVENGSNEVVVLSSGFSHTNGYLLIENKLYEIISLNTSIERGQVLTLSLE
jgi:hypothetical protein